MGFISLGAGIALQPITITVTPAEGQSPRGGYPWRNAATVTEYRGMGLAADARGAIT